MEPRLRNDVGSLVVRDHSVSERARKDEERLINGLKWSYTDHDHVQIVPEIQKQEEEEEENSKRDLLVVVPDEQSETGDHHHHSIDYSDTSDSLCYLRNNHQKPKRRRTEISSDEESEGFTREVPSMTTRVSKRRRDEVMSNKMRKLQQLVPNCHKMDKVSILDKTIEYMKNLQLQLQVMSMMGMNTPYIPPATLDFHMHNHLLTAMAMAHGLNPVIQMMSSPLVPVSNWPFSNLSFPHTTNQSLIASSPAFSPQCLCSLGPCIPRLPDFSFHTMGRL